MLVKNSHSAVKMEVKKVYFRQKLPICCYLFTHYGPIDAE